MLEVLLETVFTQTALFFVSRVRAYNTAHKKYCNIIAVTVKFKMHDYSIRLQYVSIPSQTCYTLAVTLLLIYIFDISRIMTALIITHVYFEVIFYLLT